MSKESNLKQRVYRRKTNRTDFYDNFVKPLVLKRDKNKCTKCGSADNLVVHHKHYDMDTLTYYDLVTLCRSCHKIEHNWSKWRLKNDLV